MGYDDRENTGRRIRERSSLAAVSLAELHNAKSRKQAKKERHCLDCDQVLSNYNLGVRCHVCAEKRAARKTRVKV